MPKPQLPARQSPCAACGRAHPGKAAGSQRARRPPPRGRSHTMPTWGGGGVGFGGGGKRVRCGLGRGGLAAARNTSSQEHLQLVTSLGRPTLGPEATAPNPSPPRPTSPHPTPPVADVRVRQRRLGGRRVARVELLQARAHGLVLGGHLGGGIGGWAGGEGGVTGAQGPRAGELPLWRRRFPSRVRRRAARHAPTSHGQQAGGQPRRARASSGVLRPGLR
jgi:hypothetical protein